MTRFENVARMARDEARARRAVLIVTRNAHQATRVMEALEAALRPRDGDVTLLHGNGLWQARSEHGWARGRIIVRVAGPGVRGQYADTLLLARDLSPYRMAEAEPTTATSPAPTVATW